MENKRKRTFVMVEASGQEKEILKKGAMLRGFKFIATWFRWLAFKDMTKTMEKAKTKVVTPIK